MTGMSRRLLLTVLLLSAAIGAAIGIVAAVVYDSADSSEPNLVASNTTSPNSLLKEAIALGKVTKSYTGTLTIGGETITIPPDAKVSWILTPPQGVVNPDTGEVIGYTNYDYPVLWIQRGSSQLTISQESGELVGGMIHPFELGVFDFMARKLPNLSRAMSALPTSEVQTKSKTITALALERMSTYSKENQEFLVAQASELAVFFVLDTASQVEVIQLVKDREQIGSVLPVSELLDLIDVAMND